MTTRVTVAFFTSLGLVLPLFTAAAQTPYSPASPVNTSSPFAGVALPRPAPAAPRQNPATAGGGTTISTPPGSYAPASQLMTSEPIDPDHKLGRGDRLNYRVVEDREPDRSYQLVVSDSGEVNLPLGGLVKAAGKTPQQLSTDIKSRLEKEYYYHATVIMGLDSVAQRASRGRVYVSGAVKSTGSVELPMDAPLTASQAVDQVGGFIDFSNPKRSYVLRNGRKLMVDLHAVETGKSTDDVVLQPGDKVFVPVATWSIKG